jgi:hypothetical protein
LFGGIPESAVPIAQNTDMDILLKIVETLNLYLLI